MSDGEALLRAIIDDPDDDTARRVYADWLDEQGAPMHARFVRAQIDLAGCLVPSGDPWADPASIDLHGVTGAVQPALLEPFLELVPHLGDPDGPVGETLLSSLGFRARRGFVEAVEVYGATTAALFVMQFPRIAARTPLLHLRFVSRSSAQGGYAMSPLQNRTLRALLAQDGARRLRTLDLETQPAPWTLAEIVLQQADRLEELESLRLDGAGLSQALHARLAARFGERLRLRPAPVPSDDDIPF